MFWEFSDKVRKLDCVSENWVQNDVWTGINQVVQWMSWTTERSLKYFHVCFIFVRSEGTLVCFPLRWKHSHHAQVRECLSEVSKQRESDSTRPGESNESCVMGRVVVFFSPLWCELLNWATRHKASQIPARRSFRFGSVLKISTGWQRTKINVG